MDAPCSNLKTRTFIICRRPMVIHIIHGRDYDFLYRLRAGSRTYFMVMFWWWAENKKAINDILQKEVRHRKTHPEHSFTYLCNTESQRRKVAEAGLDALHC